MRDYYSWVWRKINLVEGTRYLLYFGPPFWSR
jgi:hypothetical protein